MIFSNETFNKMQWQIIHGKTEHEHSTTDPLVHLVQHTHDCGQSELLVQFVVKSGRTGQFSQNPQQ